MFGSSRLPPGQAAFLSVHCDRNKNFTNISTRLHVNAGHIAKMAAGLFVFGTATSPRINVSLSGITFLQTNTSLSFTYIE